jgi:bacterioferritin-associated ferredoxin
MFACQCKWLTYKQLGELVDSGVDTLAAIQSQYGVGTECGGCLGALQQYFAAVQEAKVATPPTTGEPDSRINDSAA